MKSSVRAKAGRKASSRLLASLVIATALVGGVALKAYGGGWAGVSSAESRALRDRVAADAPELTPVYEARKYRPIWIEKDAVRPEAKALVATIASAGADGLDPEALGLTELRQQLMLAGTGEPEALARFETHASLALVKYLTALHTPASSEQMVYTDLAAAPSAMSPLSILQGASQAASLSNYLSTAQRMNPVYDELRRSLAAHRSRSPKGAPDVTEQLLLINMDRARALPADPGPRFLIVDTAGAVLWMYENGKPVDSMKVVVGKRDEPTPLIAGMIRYALFNPYWNIPEDLVRDSWAPRVLKEGPGVIASKQMEALSDWSPQAKVLDPAAIDWEAVAMGRESLRMRQRPGPANMMGKVKFMMPNDLGIYLHDTPNKALFEGDARWSSAGCVRLEDAERLTQWLFGGRPKAAGPDQRVDLPNPVPVYMLYLTATPRGSDVVARPDVYGWDSVRMARRDRDAAA